MTHPVTDHDHSHSQAAGLDPQSGSEPTLEQMYDAEYSLDDSATLDTDLQTDSSAELTSDNQHSEQIGLGNDTDTLADDTHSAVHAEQSTATTDWQQQAQEWQHKFQSSQGRVSALQTKVTKLEQSAPQAYVPPTQSEETKELLEEMSELDSIVTSQNEALRGQHETSLNIHNQLTEDAHYQLEQEQANQQSLFKNTIGSVHDDFETTWNSPEFVSYYQGLDQYEKQRAMSTNPADVIQTLNNFKAQTAAPKPQTRKPAGKPSSTGAYPAQAQEGEFDLAAAMDNEYN